jgi:tetratricopeptide (TPR) repeat protein
MKTTRWLVVLTIGAVTGLTLGAATDIPKLVNQLRSADTQGQASLKLIEIGLPAIKPLIDGACDKDGTLSFAAGDALREITLRARDRGGAAYDRAEACKGLLEVLKTDTRPAARELAVQMLGLIGRDDVVPALADALNDEALRQQATASLRQIPGKAASEALAGLARSAPKVQDRISAIYALGTRCGCKIAVAALLTTAKDKDVAIQLAAVKALGQTGDLSALPTVQMIAEKGAEQVKPAARDACLRLAEAAVKQGKNDKALAVYDRVARMGKDPLCQAAAIAGYACVANRVSTGKLIAMWGKISPEADRQIIRDLARMPGSEVTTAIAEACKKAPVDLRVQLLTVLGMRRDPHGFSTLLSAGKSADDKIAAAAIEAMGLTGAAGMDAAILDALVKGRPAVKAPAVNSSLAIARRLMQRDPAGSAGKVLKVYQEALANSPDEACRIAVIDAIGGTGCRQMLSDLEKLFDTQGAVREAAINAYLSIADKMSARKEGKQALAMYNRILDMNAVPAARLQGVIERMKALGDKSDIPGRLGLITQWWVIGPWPNPDWSAFDKVWSPEKEIDLTKTYKEGDKEMKWKPVGTSDPTGRIDLKKAVTDADNVAAYAYAEITCDADQDVVFRTGSDDGMKLWVNGKQVFGKNEPRGLTVDQDTIPAHLLKGVNKVLVKVLQGGGNWEFCTRVTTPDGKPVKLKVRPAK